MIEMFWIWLYLGVGDVLASLGFLGGSGLVFWAFFSVVSSAPPKDNLSWGMYNHYPLARKLALSWVIIFSVASLYPSKDDLKFIIGGAIAWNTGEYLMASEEARRIPDNVLRAANAFLEGVVAEKESNP